MYNSNEKQREAGRESFTSQPDIDQGTLSGAEGEKTHIIMNR